MIRRPPRSTLTDTLLPYTTLFRSCAVLNADDPNVLRMSGYTRQDHLLRDDESVALAGARAYPCRRARLRAGRSEEHTSELQSLMRISYAVFCLKKKNNTKNTDTHTESTPQT